MNNIPGKLTSIFAVASLALGLVSFAAAENICPIASDDDEIVFGFFNGVQNSVNEAVQSLVLLRNEHGDEIQYRGKLASIRYDLFYNVARTGIGDYLKDRSIRRVFGPSRNDSDFDEVKKQIAMEIADGSRNKALQNEAKKLRSLDGSERRQSLDDSIVDQAFQGRYEYLFGLLGGSERRGWLMAIENANWFLVDKPEPDMPRPSPDTYNLYVRQLNDFQAGLHELMYFKIAAHNFLDISEPERTALLDYEIHRAHINQHVLMGRKLLFVAHSQGNLFVNRAYDYAVRQPGVTPDAVKVVHIAPASYRLAYPDAVAFLASEDLVIAQALKVLTLEYDMSESALNRNEISVIRIPNLVARARMDLERHGHGNVNNLASLAGQVVGDTAGHLCSRAAVMGGAFVGGPAGSIALGVASEKVCSGFLGAALGTLTESGMLVMNALKSSTYDMLGHGLSEVYLNKTLPEDENTPVHAGSLANILQLSIRSSLRSLAEAPRMTPSATQGFFTAMLKWDGTGDVDLHVREPGGQHVYYGNQRGEAGELDVDNTVANGPEHYFASCDSDRLQLGTYTISVKNFAFAQGRRATVMLSGWTGDGWGVTGNRSAEIRLNDNNEHTLFHVRVEALLLPQSNMGAGIDLNLAIPTPEGVTVAEAIERMRAVGTINSSTPASAHFRWRVLAVDPGSDPDPDPDPGSGSESPPLT